MTIETKFDKSSTVLLIHKNSLKRFRVYSIEYRDGDIWYKFMESQGPTLMDKDRFIEREESECWLDLNEFISAHSNI